MVAGGRIPQGARRSGLSWPSPAVGCEFRTIRPPVLCARSFIKLSSLNTFAIDQFLRAANVAIITMILSQRNKMNFQSAARIRHRAGGPVHWAVANSQSANAPELFEFSGSAAEDCYPRLGSSVEGLTAAEASARLQALGLNLITRERKPTILQEIWGRARNPLNALLLTLAAVSHFLGDDRAAIVIVVMVLLAITTAFVQEHRSNAAAARLRAMVRTTASVKRRTQPAEGQFDETPIGEVVPGDIVRLSAGDMIPADLRLIEAKDLFVNQSALTGEAMPAEKFAHACEHPTGDPF